MSATDDVLKANEAYSQNFNLGQLPIPPARKLAIVACMDARVSVEQFLGLKTGDAHVIRNAGGLITDDALRSLILSHHLLGTEEFIIINHTDCGMLKFKDAALRAQLQEKTGAIASEPKHFYSFTDLEENLRRQIDKVQAHPWIPKHIPVRGFIYDVKTGRLQEVESKSARKAG